MRHVGRTFHMCRHRSWHRETEHEHDVRTGWCDRVCHSFGDPGERTHCTGRVAGTHAGRRIRWRLEEPSRGSSWSSASVKRSPSATMSRSSVLPRWRDNGQVDVLNLTATGWKGVQALIAPNPSAQSDFGRVLTFRDGVLVVGGGNAAYVFKRGNRFSGSRKPSGRPQLMAWTAFRSRCVTKGARCSQAGHGARPRASCTSSSGTRPACSCAERK